MNEACPTFRSTPMSTQRENQKQKVRSEKHPAGKNPIRGYKKARPILQAMGTHHLALVLQHHPSDEKGKIKGYVKKTTKHQISGPKIRPGFSMSGHPPACWNFCRRPCSTRFCKSTGTFRCRINSEACQTSEDGWPTHQVKWMKMWKAEVNEQRRNLYM